ncbi:MAG: hypothetical protein ACR2PF_18455 [Rhizobiaceae bacterium]
MKHVAAMRLTPPFAGFPWCQICVSTVTPDKYEIGQVRLCGVAGSHRFVGLVLVRTDRIHE